MRPVPELHLCGDLTLLAFNDLLSCVSIWSLSVGQNDPNLKCRLDQIVSQQYRIRFFSFMWFKKHFDLSLNTHFLLC